MHQMLIVDSSKY